jgi:radical SAM-linked protein
MRLRITFSKSGALRYTGHLDLHSIWERTIRRSGLPLAYTQGFHPGPKIQLASALPLGFIGRAEIVDVWLNEPQADEPVRHYAELIQIAAPPGLGVVSVERVDEHAPALQTQVTCADYEVILLDPLDELDLTERVAAILGATSLPRERRGKQYDLRPLIENLGVLPAEGSGTARLQMRLAARDGATGRPEEVLDAMGIPVESARIERTRQILKDDIK